MQWMQLKKSPLCIQGWDMTAWDRLQEPGAAMSGQHRESERKALATIE